MSLCVESYTVTFNLIFFDQDTKETKVANLFLYYAIAVAQSKFEIIASLLFLSSSLHMLCTLFHNTQYNTSERIKKIYYK